MQEKRYCKRLIEVDLPIRKISDSAIYEKKSAGHGHLTTIHIWWARRPLAACRSVICAAVWPDPLDSLCPSLIKKKMGSILKEFRDKRGGKLYNWEDESELRSALLEFLAEFSKPDNSNNKDFILTSQELTKSSLESCDGKALLVDPFSGGGSIPLEALRIGLDAFASDLNPVAALLNKVVLEYMPKFGRPLAEEVNKWGTQILYAVRKELENIYTKNKKNGTIVACIWARTIKCEGPGCGAILPLVRNLWLSKKSTTKVALKIIPDKKNKKIDFKILINPDKNIETDGTVRRGSVTCPICSYTTPVGSVRRQLLAKEGGRNDAQLIALVLSKTGTTGRIFSIPNESDFEAVNLAKTLFKAKQKTYLNKNTKMPLDEELPLMSGVFNAPIYGMIKWGQLYTDRQMLVLLSFSEKINFLRVNKEFARLKRDLQDAVLTCLGLIQSKLADVANSLCNWEPNVPCVQHLFGRQAIQMSWDFAEGNILGNARGSWLLCQESFVKAIQANVGYWKEGQVEICNAAKHILPDSSVDIIVTDPPYYNAVPFADLSDFFYLWLKQVLTDTHKNLFTLALSPKEEEICEMASWDEKRYAHKDKAFFESKLKEAFEEMRRIMKPTGILVVAFAHKSTSSWEALLNALTRAGWKITASWPIDTELQTRLRAMNSATLASSIWLVARPRVNSEGKIISNYIGDWRDILQDVPKRIHEWMPRLASEGIVGADAIFACLGPALEIFSKYSHVEKANGDKVELREYLEQVWGAVAKEALNMIFQGVRTEGFEEDSRLTAMWLWTLSTGLNNGKKILLEKNIADETKVSSPSFSLEFDAARKIAQGLGAHLENLSSVIEIKGDQARLISVAERVINLFGKGSTSATTGRKKKKETQMTLFEEFNEVEDQDWSLNDEKSAIGKTVLDRLHQAMILFGAGRGDAMRRFLVEEGVGKDERFWRLAQALSALYPSHTDEKRWVDGVLARKKSLGF
jgi:putative DNA methylase